MDRADQIRLEDLKYVAQLQGLFKYTSAENALLLLDNCSLHFNSPLQFNDPFDCHPLLVKINDQFVIKTLKNGGYANILNQRGFKQSPAFRKYLADFGKVQQKEVEEKMLPNIKITCFSERKDNLLMWSHYAKYHSGVCIEFCTIKLIAYLAELSKLKDGRAGIFLRVKYEAQRTNYLFESSADTYPLIMWLKTKSLEWTYEEEIRLLILKWEEYNLGLIPGVIKKIYLGSRIVADKKEKIISICRSLYPDTEIYQTSPSVSEFKLLETKV